MATFFGYKRLMDVNDWKGLAGEGKWVPTRSAYELAHSWHRSGGLPVPIANALMKSGHELLRGIAVDLCLVEKPVFLDTRVAPSMTDLMAYGRNEKGDDIVVAVEGKADEPFALRVSEWVRGNGTMKKDPRPTRLQRLHFLSQHLGIPIGPESTLRYQLLHRTVSAILEGQLHGAAASVVLIHAFGPKSTDNFADYSRFLQELGQTGAAIGTVSGPSQLGPQRNMSTFFLWWQDHYPT